MAVDDEKLVKKSHNYHSGVKHPDWDMLANHEGREWLWSEQWRDEFSDKPLHLDIGSGMGRFLMSEAEKCQDALLLGVDPDYQCAKRILTKCHRRFIQGTNMDHVRFYHGSIYHLLPHLKEGDIGRVYLNYPDPWFKKRHYKRRVVTDQLFDTIGKYLVPEAEIYIQTDDGDYAEFIKETIVKRRDFKVNVDAEPLFKELSTTLYQEKAAKNGASRYCFHLVKLENS